jgi:uncharacterized protein (TIGR03083 family)
MPDQLTALGGSVRRLRELVEPLDDAALERSAYPSEWTIADVLSHVGSGATIMLRRVDDSLAGRDTPDDFAPEVWDTWNAKRPRAQVDDGLQADAALVERITRLSDAERASFRMAMGPLRFNFDEFVGTRLNEHAFHTWDVEVALDADATIPSDLAALVVDNLDLIARYTAKPVGPQRSIVVRTSDPARTFVVTVGSDQVGFAPAEPDAPADLELPAEAFARLVYGRLDREHAAGVPERDVVDQLREVFPGP